MFLWSLAFFFVLGFIVVSCNKDNGEEIVIPDKGNGITAFANFNPAEPIILDVSNDKGESVVLMGVKNSSGYPELLQQMRITTLDEENPTEVYFDNEQRVIEMIASNGVRFQFDWLSDSEAALTLIEPNTNEQLNTVVDFSKQNLTNEKASNQSSSSKKRIEKSELSIEPILKMNVPSQTKALAGTDGGIVGDVYLEQCGGAGTAQCWVDVYDYSELSGSFGKGRFRGRFTCTKVGDGHYQYQLPSNYHVHHNIADYCDAINDVVSTICDVNAYTAPGSGSKQYICLAISAALASGIVSAPVAAGFLAACEATSAALDISCSLINGGMDLPDGSPTLVDGLCGLLREMDYTWDTPLLLIPVVNALPSNIYGTAQIYRANDYLDYMRVTWGGKPTINSFTLVPPAPAHGVSYNAIAELYCLPTGTSVTMDIVGTDGYSDSQTSTVNSGENINYRAVLYVPGAQYSGVQDVCTVTAITPNGETISKKASLVFQ